MTDFERKWFDDLARDREENARTLMKASMRGVWSTIVDKYSDQAHFIYELLQNADDAGATEVSFKLEDQRLLFKHNGTRRFSITSLATEEQDFKSGCIGDLNAITGAGGFSTKVIENDKGNAIGKFGVGFKAVFQYTTVPEIYDDNMSFRLENYIVPVLLDGDDPWRKPGETLFVFPLDKVGVRNAHGGIWKKLNSLILPTLFLNNLKVVKFSDGEVDGSYEVRDDKPRSKGNGFRVRKVSALANTKNGSSAIGIWLFERKDSRKNRFCVGYVVDDDGKLKPVDYKAFCYFPTKHDTKLHFIIHAPFLLTDSREGLKADEEHNCRMLMALAELAADALEYLCRLSEKGSQRIVTDDVIKVIPFSYEDYGDGISFDAFRVAFSSLYHRSKVVPTKNSYVDAKHGFWPESIALTQLFSDDDLCRLKNERSIKWAFPTLPRERGLRGMSNSFVEGAFNFIKSCTRGVESDEGIIKLLTATFIEGKEFKWLYDLYKWISDNGERVEAAKKVPIFLDQNGKACAAFDESGNRILYLPLKGEDRYRSIGEKVLKSAAAKKLVRDYGLEEPSKEDYIHLLIDEKIASATDDESDAYFKQIFDYYITLPMEERRELAKRMKGKIKLWCEDSSQGVRCCCACLRYYRPCNNLKEYFRGYVNPVFDVMHGYVKRDFKTDDKIDGVKFLDVNHYERISGGAYNEEVGQLLELLGMIDCPLVLEFELGTRYRYNKGKSIQFTRGTERKVELERFIIRWVEGAPEFLDRIIAEKDMNRKREYSVVLWNLLCKSAFSTDLPHVGAMVHGFERSFLTSVHKYEYWGMNYEGFDDLLTKQLRQAKWMVMDEWTVKSPEDISMTELPSWYEHWDGFENVRIALGIKQYSENDIAHQEKIRTRNALSEEDQENIAIGEEVRNYGFSKDDLKIILEQAKARRQRMAFNLRNEDEVPDVGQLKAFSGGHDDVHDDSPKESHGEPEESKGQAPAINSTVSADIQLSRGKRNAPEHGTVDRYGPMEEVDEDEITPCTIDFEKRIRQKELKQANEIASLERGRALQESAGQCGRYTLGWFKAMLGIEMLGMEEDASNQHEIALSFTQVIKEQVSDHIYIFKRPSRNIPQWVEELTDVPLDMLIGNRRFRPRIDAMSVKSFDLRVKFKNDEDLQGIDLRDLREAKMSVQRPDFLVTSLRDGLDHLPYDDDMNLRDGLDQHSLEFVFGPPGTGKTTFLANECIRNLMNRKDGKKVLVLTPTNKAADVLAYRVVVSMPKDEDCKPWLVRFGSTNDERLEMSGINCGKNINVSTMERCCVVTTISRFPYDKYVPGNAEPVALEKVDWDYVIIDEASMIPLVNIIYVLYRKQKSKFVIAGDPFQIDPIVRNEGWRDENIYTLVHLNDFVKSKMVPKQFPVIRLTKQYRSVPCIGRLFSDYRYAGILEHERAEIGGLKVSRLGVQACRI